jgi:hypothetical protein
MRRCINVLVAVVVAVLVVGFVAVSVPRVREAAVRIQCVNNLKQIGLALHNYHDTYQAFPTATIPCEGLPAERRLSWMVEIIPYLDQIGYRPDRTKAWDAAENIEPKFYGRDVDGRDVEFLAGEIKTFHCPANPAVAGPRSPGLTHYVGIAGVGTDAAGRGAGYPGVGCFGHDRKTRQQDIKDGLASTILVIETTRDNGPWTAGGRATVRGLDPNGGPYFGTGGQFGSNHQGGPAFALKLAPTTNVLFADCSVRNFTDSVKPEVLEALATIAGGEEVDLAECP